MMSLECNRIHTCGRTLSRLTILSVLTDKECSCLFLFFFTKLAHLQYLYGQQTIDVMTIYYLWEPGWVISIVEVRKGYKIKSLLMMTSLWQREHLKHLDTIAEVYEDALKR